MSRKYVDILGVRVDSARVTEVLDTIRRKIEKKAKFLIVTPNPEIVLASTRDPQLKAALDSADISVADGAGLRLADCRLPIIHGRVLMGELMELAVSHGWKIFLLGGRPGVAELAVSNLRKKYCRIDIDCSGGPMLDGNADPVSERDRKIENETLDKINRMRPDILFVAFGCPKQEKWVYKNRSKLNTKCIMVVGGAVDYLAGIAPLPPKWMERLELEWLWRLLTQKGRLVRIFNAVIIFPLRLLQARLKVGGH